MKVWNNPLHRDSGELLAQAAPTPGNKARSLPRRQQLRHLGATVPEKYKAGRSPGGLNLTNCPGVH